MHCVYLALCINFHSFIHSSSSSRSSSSSSAESGGDRGRQKRGTESMCVSERVCV